MKKAVSLALIAAAILLVLPATALAAPSTFVTLPNEELETSWDLDSMTWAVDQGTGEPWDLYLSANTLHVATVQVAMLKDVKGHHFADASWGSVLSGDKPFLVKTTQGNYFKVKVVKITEAGWTFLVSQLRAS